MDSIDVLEEVTFLVETHFTLIDWAYEGLLVSVNAKVRVELA